MRLLVVALASVSCLFLTATSGKAPNIVLFLTDDLDCELGGVTPLAKTKQWVGDEGVTFDNAFVVVPICCPSRSSILTGLYQASVKCT